MSLTPGSIKSSPFGNAINKNLLTPCRRVGLSRKKITSNSLTKLLSHDLNNSNCENSPINKNASKRNSQTAFDSPADTNSTNVSKKMQSRVKKSLGRCFENGENAIKDVNKEVRYDLENGIKNLPKKEKTCSEIQFETSASRNNKNDGFKKESNYKIKVENEFSKSAILNEDNCNENDVKSGFIDNIEIKTGSEMYEQKQASSISITDETSSTSSSPIVKHPHKRKILYDSDEEFVITENVDTKLKTYERKKSVDKSNYLRTEVTDSFKNCSINLERLSEDDITLLEENCIKKIVVSSDEEEGIIKKKSTTIDHNENDNCQSFIKKSVKTQKVVEKVSKNTHSTKEKINKISKVPSNTVSSTFEDEDDAFTSTPDREKNEKCELISKIKALEKVVNDKRIKLDNLKRASLYKSKHNIEELKSVTDLWKQGCILGLEALLKQLQSHGPMNMSTLLRNLQISPEVASKVFINTT